MKTKKCIIHGNVRWRVLFKDEGKWKRKFFEKESDANQFAKKFDKLRKENTYDKELMLLSESVKIDIIEAIRKLPKGKTLLDSVIRAWSYVSEFTPEYCSKGFLDVKTNTCKSPDEYTHVKGRITNFIETFKTFDEATHDKILEYLKAKGSPKTVINWKGTIVDFYNYCIKKEYISANPFNKIIDDDFIKLKHNSKGFLSVEKAKFFLSKLEKEYPNFVKFFILGMFAGMRSSEISKLDESCIFYDERIITLPRSIVKTQDSWLLEDLPDNLWDWLCKYRYREIIRPTNRERTDLADKFNLTHNFARHSFATYHLSLYKDVERTRFITRHTDPQTLQNAYFGALVSVDVAKEYFSILPTP